MLGTRDYVRRTASSDVLIGLSGGIDSSLVAAIAVDALGAEHVTGVLMPSRFSSEGSVTDADALAANLGIRTMTVPIEPAHAAFLEMLARAASATTPGVAEENLQARIRGNVLMTLSNKSRRARAHDRQQERDGHRLRHALRRHGRRLRGASRTSRRCSCTRCASTATSAPAREVIPDAVIEKPPSAELRPDQKDTDSLPEYGVLDPIIEGYVEDDLSIAELEADGPRRGDGAARGAADRPQRVQAPAGAARRAGVAEGVRQGPPPADHQPLARLSRRFARNTACVTSPRGSPRRARSCSRRCSSASRSRSSSDALDDIDAVRLPR